MESSVTGSLPGSVAGSAAGAPANPSASAGSAGGGTGSGGGAGDAGTATELSSAGGAGAGAGAGAGSAARSSVVGAAPALAPGPGASVAVVVADEVLSPLEVLTKAKEVLDRNEVRKHALESDHLHSLGRQLVSTRRTEPHTHFGYRPTQERKNGRITWEDAKTWKFADPAARLPGPNYYTPNVDFDYRVPGAGHTINGETRFPEEKSVPGNAPKYPTTRADFEEHNATVRPDEVKETVRYPRRPAYGFSTSGIDTRSKRGTSSNTAFKATSRLVTFREMRDQIPVSSVIDYVERISPAKDKRKT